MPEHGNPLGYVDPDGRYGWAIFFARFVGTRALTIAARPSTIAVLREAFPQAFPKILAASVGIADLSQENGVCIK